LKLWTRRVELPAIEGLDQQGSISRAEKFLAVHNVSAKENLKVEFIANHFFKFWRKNSKKPFWNEFYMPLIWRFGGKERISMFEKLDRKELQSGEDYIEELDVQPPMLLYRRRRHRWDRQYLQSNHSGLATTTLQRSQRFKFRHDLHIQQFVFQMLPLPLRRRRLHR